MKRADRCFTKIRCDSLLFLRVLFFIMDGSDIWAVDLGRDMNNPHGRKEGKGREGKRKEKEISNGMCERGSLG